MSVDTRSGAGQAASVDFGAAQVVVRRGRFSVRVHRRGVIVALILLAAIVALSVASLAVGTLSLSFDELVAVFLGRGTPQARLTVLGWRMPRLLFALLCGAALALGGAMMQSLTRNPLGSPDVLGFDAGSFTGVLVVTTLVGSGSYALVASGSLIAGVATALVVYLVAYRQGVQGFRLIVVGIAVAAFLSSVNAMLLLSTSTERAMAAAAWAAGSLSGLGYEQLVPFAIVFVLLIPFVAWLSPAQEQSELGDDAAQALGSRPERTRLLASLVAVALTALVTAAAGPITFVALVAPQIARRLTRSPGVGLVAAALMGAVLLSSADFVAQRIALPVGVVTVAVGGGYFLWMLTREYRRS